jgi:hypothetical protein
MVIRAKRSSFARSPRYPNGGVSSASFPSSNNLKIAIAVMGFEPLASAKSDAFVTGRFAARSAYPKLFASTILPSTAAAN